MCSGRELPPRAKTGVKSHTNTTTSRTKFAFGSRIPICGKENLASNVASLSASSISSQSILKPPSRHTTTLSRQRVKRRRSVACQENDHGLIKKIPISSPVHLAEHHHNNTILVQKTSSVDVAPQIAGVAQVDIECIQFQQRDQLDQPQVTDPLIAMKMTPPRIAFAVMDASDPEFWKSRIAYVENARIELKKLE